MTPDAVLALVRDELARTGEFENFHGISSANLAQFLVIPRPVSVDPDSGEAVREMWLVLEERTHGSTGYVVVFDPYDSSWVIAERGSGDAFVAVIAAASLRGALEGM